MRQILLALLGLVFLQLPLNNCYAHSSVAYGYECATELQNGTVDPEEERTEKNFYGFVSLDVIKSKQTTKKDGAYYYAEFQKANDAFNAILNLISPASDRKKFDKTKKYESDLLLLVWKENEKGKTVVKDGFAQIDVTFKKRGEKYTVVFYKK